LSLSWMRGIQSSSFYHISSRSILLLSTNLCIGFVSGLFPSSFPYWNTSCISSLCMPHHITWPSQTWIVHPNIGQEYKL
jgi:hypothetical protein